MKTIIRIGNVFDTPEAIASKKFSSFGIKTLVEGYAPLRKDLPEAVLLVSYDEERRPVYITLGPNPPELLAGDRKVHAVFSPPDSQEPLSTFRVEESAKAWAESSTDKRDGYVIREIDSTDRLGVQPSVAVMIRRGDDILFCRLARSKAWTFPEGRLEVGESIESAARRAVRSLVGLELDRFYIGAVPYVNVFIEPAAQHFLVCVLVADLAEGASPAVVDPHGIIDHCEWYPATNPPMPLFHTVQGLIRLLDAKKPEPTPSIAVTPTIETEITNRTDADLIEKAKQYVKDALSEQLPFLITGTPRSGTQYATEVFKRAFAKHDTDVCHEAVGSLATVSWCHVNPAVSRKYWSQAAGDRTGQYVYDCLVWSAVVHQTRHPLKVIASMPTIPFAENGGWDSVRSALDADRQRFPSYIGEIGWPDDLTSLEAWASFVWRWNRYVEGFASFRYRVEDLHGGEGSVWPRLIKHLGLDPVPFPEGPFYRDPRPHEVVTWDDIKAQAPDYYEALREMAVEYGYDD